MKLGLGLNRHQLNREHYRFARQAACTHLVIHLVDYFQSSRSIKPGDQPLGDHEGWGRAGDPDRLWSAEEMKNIRDEAADEGLEIAAIENFDPAHWHDILLDGPLRAKHIENVKTIIHNTGAAGIPVFGYNFPIAGVAGRFKGPFARGEAEAVGMDGPYDMPLPKGMAWNMVVEQYKETFIDEGDVDVFRVVKALKDHGFEGVIIPDYAPQMSCNAPWCAGMSFALGYLRVVMQSCAV